METDQVTGSSCCDQHSVSVPFGRDVPARVSRLHPDHILCVPSPTSHRYLRIPNTH